MEEGELLMGAYDKSMMVQNVRVSTSNLPHLKAGIEPAAHASQTR